jgi:ankyrin repeat protein
MKFTHYLIFLLVLLVQGNTFAQNQKAKDFKLLTAAYEGQTDSVIHLIMDSANVNARSDEGITPLMYAAEKGNEDIVKILLYNKANPNLIPYSGRTALISAAIQNHPEIVYDLLLYGANINATDDVNATALTYCSGYNLIYMVQYLLENHANTKIMTVDSTDALLCAAYYGNVEIVSMLLSHNDSVNSIDTSGFTPFSVAVQNGDLALLDTLIKHSASSEFNFHSKAIKNLVDYARVLNQKRTIKTLRKQGLHGTFPPYINKITLSYNPGSFSIQDYYMGAGIGVFDSKYNFQLELGFNGGLTKKRILEKQSDSVYYQLWEKRRYLYLCLDKSFTFPSKNHFERQGIFIRLKGLYSFGVFDAMRHRPQGKFALLPGLGYSYSYKSLYIKAAYEYGKIEPYSSSPHWISLSVGVALIFRDATLTKKISWM